MIIGVPQEIKEGEYRVALPPSAVSVLVDDGHELWVEEGAGTGCGFIDRDYLQVGARIIPDHAAIFGQSELVVKVKEPQPSEYDLLQGTILSFLHLAATATLTHALLDGNVIALGYETVELPDGTLPLLIPMSEIAGRVAVQMAAFYLGKRHGGSGKLLGGVPGVSPCEVVILGGGVVGFNAALMALGLGGRVTILNRSVERLRHLAEVLHGNITTLALNSYNVRKVVKEADILIGAVLTPGGKPPLLVTREMVKGMKEGSVIVDVSVDQGGCIETTHPTSHSQPTYILDGVVHYGVDNIPGAYPLTSTWALSNVLLPYVRRVAKLGLVEAIRSDSALAKGINVFRGHLTCKAVAEALTLPFTPLEGLIEETDE